jgi:hypothetical protein
MSCLGRISFQEISYAGKPQVVSKYILSNICFKPMEECLLIAWLHWRKALSRNNLKEFNI